jgi:hypothetical protein
MHAPIHAHVGMSLCLHEPIIHRRSSTIRTIPSALDSHQCLALQLAALVTCCNITAGQELHPAPKIDFLLYLEDSISVRLCQILSK